MTESINRTVFDFENIKKSIEELQGEKSVLNEQIDILEENVRQLTVLLNARETQLQHANQQINDLLSVIHEKVVLIKCLESRIEWINNHPAYRLYSKITRIAKIFKSS